MKKSVAKFGEVHADEDVAKIKQDLNNLEQYGTRNNLEARNRWRKSTLNNEPRGRETSG